MAPNKTIFAFFWSRKMIDDISIKRKPANINQKVPISNMVPKRETCRDFKKRAESRKASTIAAPANSIRDLGKVILPSKNLAKPQEKMLTARPITKRSPFDVSTEMLLQGRKKSGSKIITKKIDKKDRRSNMFVRMGKLYYTPAEKYKPKLDHYVDKSVFYVFHLFRNKVPKWMFFNHSL